MDKIRTKTIGNFVVALTALFLVSACSDKPPPAAAPESHSDTPRENMADENADQCAGNVDYEIMVKFKKVGDVQCPEKVIPPDGFDCPKFSVGGLSVSIPDCIKVKKIQKPSGAPTTIRWTSDPSGISFAVFFDPLVGPQHKSHNGCVTGTIAGSAGNLKKIPPGDADSNITYKYTIAALESSAEKTPAIASVCESLDPPIIIEH